MKRFRSKRHSFEVELPSGWRCLWTGRVGRFLGRDEKLIFKGSEGFFSVEVGPSFSGMSIKQVRAHILKHAHTAGHVEVETGSFSVQGKQHLWARYRTIGEAAMRLPAAQRIVRITKIQYSGIVGSMDTSSWLAQMERHSVGPLLKTYWLAFDRGVYELTASLGFGPMSDIEDLADRETTYDRIVSTFRVVA